MTRAPDAERGVPGAKHGVPGAGLGAAGAEAFLLELLDRVDARVRTLAGLLAAGRAFAVAGLVAAAGAAGLALADRPEAASALLALPPLAAFLVWVNARRRAIDPAHLALFLDRRAGLGEAFGAWWGLRRGPVAEALALGLASRLRTADLRSIVPMRGDRSWLAAPLIVLLAVAAGRLPPLEPEAPAAPAWSLSRLEVDEALDAAGGIADRAEAAARPDLSALAAEAAALAGELGGEGRSVAEALGRLAELQDRNRELAGLEADRQALAEVFEAIEAQAGGALAKALREGDPAAAERAARALAEALAEGSGLDPELRSRVLDELGKAVTDALRSAPADLAAARAGESGRQGSAAGETLRRELARLAAELGRKALNSGTLEKLAKRVLQDLPRPELDRREFERLAASLARMRHAVAAHHGESCPGGEDHQGPGADPEARAALDVRPGPGDRGGKGGDRTGARGLRSEAGGKDDRAEDGSGRGRSTRTGPGQLAGEGGGGSEAELSRQEQGGAPGREPGTWVEAPDVWLAGRAGEGPAAEPEPGAPSASLPGKALLPRVEIPPAALDAAREALRSERLPAPHRARVRAYFGD